MGVPESDPESDRDTVFEFTALGLRGYMPRSWLSRPLGRGWSIRLQPVFHPQSRDALKFALVVGDDRGA